MAGSLPVPSGGNTLGGESEENIPHGSHPKHSNARGSTSTAKKGQDSCSLEVVMPAVGFRKPHRILGYARPMVSQGAEPLPKGTCYPLSSNLNLKPALP